MPLDTLTAPPQAPAAPADAGDLRVIAGAAVFSGLSDRQRATLLAHGAFVELAAGSVILQEGGPSPYLQVICRGEVEVRKREPVTRRAHVVSVLGAGETFGELGLVRSSADGPPKAIASVVACVPVRLFRVPIEELRSAISLSGIHRRSIDNTARLLAGRLERSNELVVSSLKQSLLQQKLLGQYLISIIVIFSLFSLSMFALNELVSVADGLGLSRANFRTLHSVLFTVLLFGGLLFALRQAKMDLPALGVGLGAWRSDLAYALRWSLPLILAMAPLRALLYPDEPLLYPYALLREQPESAAYRLGLFLFYVAVIIWLQEFVTRVALQAVIFDLLAERRRAASVLSVGVSALGFGSFHAFYGLGAVAATVLIGLYWGVMFDRRRSLLAVGLSHMLIGAVGWYLYGLIR